MEERYKMNKGQKKLILGACIVSQLVWIECVVFIVVFLCDGWKARFLGVVLCLAMSAATALLVITVVVERDLKTKRKREE